MNLLCSISLYSARKKDDLSCGTSQRKAFGGGFERICQALAEIALAHPDVEVVYPVHLNPNVSEPVKRILHGINNIKINSTARLSAFVLFNEPRLPLF